MKKFIVLGLLFIPLSSYAQTRDHVSETLQQSEANLLASQANLAAALGSDNSYDTGENQSSNIQEKAYMASQMNPSHTYTPDYSGENTANPPETMVKPFAPSPSDNPVFLDVNGHSLAIMDY